VNQPYDPNQRRDDPLGQQYTQPSSPVSGGQQPGGQPPGGPNYQPGQYDYESPPPNPATGQQDYNMQPRYNFLPPQVSQITDRFNVGILAAGAVAVFTCLAAVCAVGFLVLSGRPPSPGSGTSPTAAAFAGGATNTPFALNTGTNTALLTPGFTPPISVGFGSPTPQFGTTPVVGGTTGTVVGNTGAVPVGTFLNPYDALGNPEFNAMRIEVRDPNTNAFVQTQLQPLAAQIDEFEFAMNIGAEVATLDPTCTDDVRFSIQESTGEVTTITACLRNVVVLRGAIPGLNGGELIMGPYFTDILLPYLPTIYQQKLATS
jgi:hypothetical protein